MAKKERREVPESELTEEEVRRWFNRLRELFKESQHRVHEMKVERGKLRVENEKLKREIRFLTRELNNVKNGKPQKRVNEKVEVVEFKKKFLDSLLS